MEDNLTRYYIALSFIQRIGDISAKKLIAYCGDVEAVFNESKFSLLNIPGINEGMARNLTNQKSIEEALERADKEIEYNDKHGIQTIHFLADAYPKRLTNCHDSPLLLYYKGSADLNKQKIISIVGTRKMTSYGRICTEKLLYDLVKYDLLVLSGLAYGVDIMAHKSCLNYGLRTVGVLAHGLDRIYPAAHESIADKMVEKGGLLTEYPINTNPDRENFPQRNRIVAGMSDAIIVIESGSKGGALITVDIANSYNRDVFAFPGRVVDDYSMGCNNLIKTNRASLIESAEDLIYIMGWEESRKVNPPVQKQLFVELNNDENLIINALTTNNSMPFDELSIATNLSSSKLSSTLLMLELNGLVKCRPGKIYQLL